ncbi:MAG: RHS repeat-associated core domain-containing protein [Kofleriaceae bacterium]
MSSLALLSIFGNSLGAPGAAYNVGAPAPQYKSASAAPESPTEEVSRDGEVTQVITVPVPMGRNGAAPAVALTYGSRNPQRGGIAAGWQLPIPVIRLDTSQGRAKGRAYSADGRKLVAVTEPGAATGRTAYRAEGDTTFARYEKVDDGTEGGYWIVRHSDGSTRYYGSSANSKDVRTEGTIGDDLYGNQNRWFLSETRDASGNQVLYNYESVVGYARNGAVPTVVDKALRSIDYGRNVNDASTIHHARIDFVWQSALTTCTGSNVPVGAKFDYRSGVRVYEGARKLLAIQASVRSAPGAAYVVRRELALTYDATAETCGGTAAPRRVLTAVQERAWAPDGSLTTLPPRTFEYTAREVSFAGAVPDPNALPHGLGYGKEPLDPSKPGGWPTTDAMMLDLDGNGTPELRTAAALGAGLPKQPWADGFAPSTSTETDKSEGVSLTAQVTHRATSRGGAAPPNGPGYRMGIATNFNSYRFIDTDGDGLLDLVTSLFYQKGGYRPTEDTTIKQGSTTSVASDYPACTAMPQPRCQLANGVAVPCLTERYRQAVLPLDGGWSGYSATAQTSDDDVLTDCIPGPELIPQSQFRRPGQPAFAGFDVPPWFKGVFTHEPLRSTYSTEFDSYGAPGGTLSFGRASTLHEAVVVDNQNTYTGYVPDLHCGHYVYRVYRNKGSAAGGSWFSNTPSVVFSPVPLDTDQLVGNLGTGPAANVTAYRGLADLDGDSRPDAVYMRPPLLDGPFDTDHRNFQVWLGSSTGYELTPGGRSWNAPALANGARPVLHLTEPVLPQPTTGDNAHGGSRETFGLRDVNGDGLLDHVRSTDQGLYVFYNTGTGFESAGTRLSAAPLAFHETVTVNPKSWDGTSWVDNPLDYPEAYTVNTSDSVDLDVDGLDDLITASPPPGGTFNPFAPSIGATMTGYLNVGDALVPAQTPAAAALLAERRAAVLGTNMEAEHRWRSVAGFADVNGDGLYDLVEPTDTWACPNGPSDLYDYASCPYFSQVRFAVSQPIGLLSAVNNGYGGRSVFTYAPTSDPAVVHMADGYRLRAPLWVAKSRSVSSGTAGEAAQVTDYQYTNPVSNTDRLGEHGFRGFETVTVTGPTPTTARRLRTRTTYAFDQDKLGLPKRTIVSEVFAAQSNREELLSYTDSAYQTLTILGAVRAYTLRDTSTVQCTQRPAGTTDTAIAACDADSVRDRTVTTWTSLGTNNTMFVASQDRRTTSTSATPVAGDLLTVPTYELRSTASEFRLLNPVAETRDGTGAVLSRAVVEFEAGPRALPMRKHVTLTLDTIATTEFTYTASGNVETVTRPNQVARVAQGQLGFVTAVSYDALGLYAASSGNELGQTTTTTVDVATGVTTQETAIAQATVTPTTSYKIDGLGRVREVRRTVETAPGSYAQLLVSTTAFVDVAPRNVVQRALKEGTTWVTTTTWLDGLGRVTREEAPSSSGTATNRYAFDGAGNTVNVYTTSPASATGQETSYLTWYDALGRPLGHRAPNTAQDVWAYMGKFTFHYHYPNDGTPFDYTVLEADGRGRMVRVREGFPSRTITTYGFDAADRVTSVVDADGVASTIQYDLGGRRTRVVRANTALEYSYDLHGNRTRVLHPTPSGAPDPVNYASTWTYDAIDRVVSATPALRAMSPADQAAFYTGPAGLTTQTTYAYDDVAQHGIGRLSHVTAPHGTTTYGYTVEGWLAREEHAFEVAPEGIALAAGGVESRSYDLLGNVVRVVHPDATETQYSYDDRARPLSAAVAAPGLAARVAATFVRNPAGSVVRRNSAVATTYQTFAYDPAGRTITDEVRGAWCDPACTSGVIAGEAFTYHPVGIPASMTDLATGRIFDFGYNDHLELTSAVTRNAADYVGAFTYSPGGKVNAVNLSTSLAGTSVYQRNVTHDYVPASPDRVDPAAVRSLRDAAGGAEVGSFTYDPSGNLLKKSLPDVDQRFTYDGDDRLRRVGDDMTGRTELYWYDHTGNRVLTYRSGSGAEAPSLRHRFGTTETFSDTAGTTKTTIDVTLGGQVVARVTDGDVNHMEYTFSGALGNLLIAVDESGVGTARFGYGPFGELLYADGVAAAAYDRGYEGKARDTLSGLSYFGHRYYDPTTLSWTQADPLYRLVPERAADSPRRMGLYTYVLNAPMHLVDPDGLEDRAVKKVNVERISFNRRQPILQKLAEASLRAAIEACAGDAICIVAIAPARQLATASAWAAIDTTEGTLEKPGIPDDEYKPSSSVNFPTVALKPVGWALALGQPGSSSTIIEDVGGGCAAGTAASAGSVANNVETDTSTTYGGEGGFEISPKEGLKFAVKGDIHRTKGRKKGSTVTYSMFTAEVQNATLTGMSTAIANGRTFTFPFAVTVDVTYRKTTLVPLCQPSPTSPAASAGAP